METRVLLDGLCFGEGPRWHEDRLWFSDMHDHRVIALNLEGQAETICEVPNQPSGLGWDPEGRLLVVSMLDRRLLRHTAKLRAIKVITSGSGGAWGVRREGIFWKK